MAASTDRRNARGEGLRWRSIEQGLSGPFVELAGNGVEPGLAVREQVGSVGQLSAQQPIGVFVLMKRLPKVKSRISLHILACKMKRVMAVPGTKPLMNAIRA